MTERPAADELRGPESLDPETLLEPDPQRADPEYETQPGDDLEAEPAATDDPDLAAARARAPGRDPMVLTTEELRPEEETTEYEPPYRPTPETREGVTAADERTGETIDDRLEQEEPDDVP